MLIGDTGLTDGTYDWHPGQAFTVQETHGRALRPENKVISQSEDLGWRSLYAVLLDEAPFHITETAVQHACVIYHLSHPTLVTRQITGGPRSRAVIGPRSLCLTPSDTVAEWWHAGHPRILQIYLHQSVYAMAVGELYGCDLSRVEILPKFAIQDPFMEQLAISIGRALKLAKNGHGLYVDTLAQTMAVHLAMHQSSRTRHGLSIATRTMPSWKIKRIIDFIEENLRDDLSLKAMASQVNVSPLYLPRIFRAAVGQSLHQYVIHRRIERAKQLLRSENIPIADVASCVGFSSQSHLSNWFLRRVGVSPASYRGRGDRE